MGLGNKLVGRVGISALSLAMIVAASGCTSSTESGARDTVTENVGKYDPPPAGITKPRVGVPPFNVQTAGGMGGGGAELDALAADQMTTLLDATERFRVIERTQLSKILDEQDMEGIVRAGEMAKRGQVRGVDYLLLGKVTNLRVKREDKQSGFGLAQVGGFLNFGGGDYKKKEIIITSEAGVDIRLVDPTTGEQVWSNFSEYKKTDAASSMGIDILGASAEADASIEMDEDNKGKVLRLALDDALKKGLPKLDRFLKSREVPAEETATPATPTTPSAPGTPMPPSGASVVPATPAGATAAKKFCPSCGAPVEAGAKFCPKDGTAL